VGKYLTLILMCPILLFGQANGLVTIRLGGSPLSAWNLNGNSIVDSNFLGTTNSKDLIFKTKNTEAMRIDTNGNVGIGVAVPAYMLDIEGSLEADVNFGGIFGDSIGNFIRIDSIGSYLNANSAQVTLQGNQINLEADSGVIIQGSAGLVGIGTATPTAKLHVNGTTYIEGELKLKYAGHDTLTAGIDTVYTSAVSDTSLIFVTAQHENGTTHTGNMTVTAILSGSYFVVQSLKSNATTETGDTRHYNWMIIRKE